MAAFTDAFTGTSGDSLIGRTGWSKLGSGSDSNAPFINASNQVRSAIGGADDAPLVGQDTGDTDHYVRFTALSQFPYTGTLKLRVGIRAWDRNSAYWVAYNGTDNVWELFRENARMGTYATTFVSGTVVYFYASGADIRVELDGVERLGATDTTLTTNMRVGILAMTDGTVDPVLDDWESDVGLYSAGDTTAPTLTSVSGTDTGSTSATVSVSSTEAGPGWAVLTPTSAQPDPAEVEAGQDHTGSSTGVFLDTATLAIGANPAAFAFTGLTPGATYWPHVVAKDTATPTANVSLVESGPSFTMPALPLKVTVTLYQEDGTTPAASITGLQWAWWDDATPDLSLAADVSGTGAGTDASGVFDVTLTGTALELGDTGTLLIYKTDGTAESTATLSFCGPLEVVN